MSATQEKTEAIQAQPLRRWQHDALSRYFEADHNFFLARVTPGAGKTYWALRVAREEYDRKRICRIVVVVPTDAIRKQWIEESPKFVGIKLADFDTWDNTCHGIVTTYQQVASKNSTETLRGYCREQSTMVIFDEIHHASDKNTWGERIVSALGGARIILGLTGTPFRSDGKPVPFVRYEADLCQPDFSYSYPEALADNIVRSLQFQVYNGTTSWRREGQEATGEVLAQAHKRDLPAALGSALDPDSNFARSMIEGAHAKLLELPAWSAGLLVAKDTDHANALAKLLFAVTGIKPMVIHSKPGADGGAKKLKEFKDSKDQWIVSVRMASEGVDIPRIRVVCWMTNCMTQLYFEQLIARGLRGPAYEECWVIMPEHKQLMEMSFAVTHAEIPRLKKKGLETTQYRGAGDRVGLEFMGSDGYLSRVFSPIELYGHNTNDSEAMLEKLKINVEYEEKRRQSQEYKAYQKAYQESYSKDYEGRPEVKKRKAENAKKRRSDPLVKELSNAKRRESHVPKPKRGIDLKKTEARRIRKNKRRRDEAARKRAILEANLSEADKKKKALNRAKYDKLKRKQAANG